MSSRRKPIYAGIVVPTARAREEQEALHQATALALNRKKRNGGLVNPQRGDHALLLASFGSESVGNLKPNFHRVAFTGVNAIQEHVLLHSILLLGRNLSARLWAKLQCVGLGRC